MCCNVFLRVAVLVATSTFKPCARNSGVLQCVAACCSVVQCVSLCYSMLQCVAVCCSVLQCVAVLVAESDVELFTPLVFVNVNMCVCS